MQNPFANIYQDQNKSNNYQSVFDSEQDLQNDMQNMPQQLKDFILQQQKSNKKLSANDILQNLQNLQKKSKPLNTKEYLKLYENGSLNYDEDGGLLIEPQKEFVIKTFNKINQEKIFLNVLSHPVLQEPEETELVDQNQPAFRIPMSVGIFVEVFDNKNKPCQAVDLIVHPMVIKNLNIQKIDNENLQFFYQLVQNYIIQKYRVNLYDQFKLMKKCTYKGNFVQFQRVKAKKKPKIQVLDSKENKNTNKKLKKQNEEKMQNLNKENLIDHQQQAIQPEWQLSFKINDQVKEFDGVNLDLDEPNLQSFIIKIKLPLMSTAKFMKLLVSDQYLNLSNNFYILNLRLPKKIQPTKTKAIFSNQKKTLTIELSLAKEQTTPKKKQQKQKIQNKVKIEIDSEEIFEIIQLLIYRCLKKQQTTSKETTKNKQKCQAKELERLKISLQPWAIFQKKNKKEI